MFIFLQRKNSCLIPFIILFRSNASSFLLQSPFGDVNIIQTMVTKSMYHMIVGQQFQLFLDQNDCLAFRIQFNRGVHVQYSTF